MKKFIYFDNAATTQVDPDLVKIMLPFFSKKFGNASEYHSLGREAKISLETSRMLCAKALNAKPSEIIFTSSATESINLSHKGFIESIKNEFKNGVIPHIITTKIEHKAVLETLRHMEKRKEAMVSYLDVDRRGRIDLARLQNTIKAQTVLITIIYVNNEIGTIQDIKKIGNILKNINKKRKRKIYFHTDATQAVNYLDCDVNRLGVDFLSLTGHKINAPKGIGLLYVRENTPLIRQMDGGGQEGGLRSSTENVPYIVSLGEAMKKIKENKNEKKKKVEGLKERLIKGVLKIPDTHLIGGEEFKAPHIASFLIGGVEGEAVVLALSQKGIITSTGSACSSADLSPSYVLSALNIPPEKTHGSIRFSLGKDNSPKEVDYVLQVLSEVVERLRRMAPKF